MLGFKLNHVTKRSPSGLNLEIVGDYKASMKPNDTIHRVMDNLMWYNGSQTLGTIFHLRKLCYESLYKAAPDDTLRKIMNKSSLTDQCGYLASSIYISEHTSLSQDFTPGYV